MTDDDLDRLLHAWARERRLPDAEADRIRLAITTTAPALDAAWWCDLADRVSSTMVRAATMPEVARSAVEQALRPRPAPQPWAGR